MDYIIVIQDRCSTGNI